MWCLLLRRCVRCRGRGCPPCMLTGCPMLCVCVWPGGGFVHLSQSVSIQVYNLHASQLYGSFMAAFVRLVCARVPCSRPIVFLRTNQGRTDGRTDGKRWWWWWPAGATKHTHTHTLTLAKMLHTQIKTKQNKTKQLHFMCTALPQTKPAGHLASP